MFVLFLILLIGILYLINILIYSTTLVENINFSSFHSKTYNFKEGRYTLCYDRPYKNKVLSDLNFYITDKSNNQTIQPYKITTDPNKILEFDIIKPGKYEFSIVCINETTINNEYLFQIRSLGITKLLEFILGIIPGIIVLLLFIISFIRLLLGRRKWRILYKELKKKSD